MSERTGNREDVYLTGSPQITFWKVVYRRHTNFAIEAIEQTFNGSVGFDKKVSVTISRNGDLCADAWLEITLKRKVSEATTTYYAAESLIKDVTLEIGGQPIDKHYADWYRVYDELFRSHSENEKKAYRRLVDFVDGEADGVVKRFYVPLLFFWNRNPGLALPLIALQYHEVKLYFNFAASSAVDGIDDTFQPNASLFIDYIYLDSDERARFAAVSHEYLIEQLQFTGTETALISSSINKQQNLRLNFNHPVKFLAWVVKGAGHGEYTTGARGTFADGFAPLRTFKLQLNGHDRFTVRRGSYFNQVQPFQTLKAYPAAGVYMYSFCLKPDEHQPSGTCNFSRIDTAVATFDWKAASKAGPTLANVSDEDSTLDTADDNLTNLNIYAVNYNVLRIMSGMGGLGYSN